MITRVLLFCLIFFLVLIMGYISFFTPKDNNLERFVGKFALIAAVFAPIGIFMTLFVFQLQSTTLSRDATFRVIDRSWTDINARMVDFYDQAPDFIESLYFSWQKMPKCDQKKKPSSGCDDWYVVNYLSILIFQGWEDYLTSSNVDQTGNQIWINRFLQWTNSRLLENKWNVLKGNYARTTQHFGDFLFMVSEKEKPDSEKELYDLAIKVVQSDKYKMIIKERHQDKEKF